MPGAPSGCHARTTLSFVHHANQFLLTEGYQSREGLSQTVQGYAGILQMHEQSGIPCGLHLSGTLIEAIAWGCPWFFSLVRRLRDQGLVELIGGTYSENIIPLSSDEINGRQISEFLQIFELHFGNSEKLGWFWVPERVWDTSKISAVIQNRQLANGGYRGVFLDSRLLFPIESEPPALSRQQVDRLGPWTNRQQMLSERFAQLSQFQQESWLNRLGAQSLAGLQIAPISESLRYWIPFKEGDRERFLDLVQIARGRKLLFADDFERTAGVAGWDSTAFRRYGDFLSWAKNCGTFDFELPEIASKLNSAVAEITSIEPGSFYEFEAELGGERNGSGFTRSPEAREAQGYLQRTQLELSSMPFEAESRISELAWKHLLASHYETLWHDGGARGPTLAPWAKALASHSRHSLVMSKAAIWFGNADASSQIEFVDLDQDGEEEIVLKNNALFAVFSPRNGMRLVALFYRTDHGGALMIGNPSDDWNFQCELNQFMRIPANHPGAFCDEVGENDRYEISSTSAVDGPLLEITMINVEPQSPWFGTRKSISFSNAPSTLCMSYKLPQERQALMCKEISFSVSPDYLSLLRNGIATAKVESENHRFSVTQGKFKIELRKNGHAPLRPAGLIGHGWRVATDATDDFALEVTCSTP